MSATLLEFTEAVAASAAAGTVPPKAVIMLELSGCGQCQQTLAAVKKYKSEAEAGTIATGKHANQKQNVMVIVINKTRFGKTLTELKTIPALAGLIPLQSVIENASAFPVVISIRNRVNTLAAPQLVFKASTGNPGIAGIFNFLSGRSGYAPFVNISNLFGLGLGGSKSSRSGTSRTLRRSARGRSSSAGRSPSRGRASPRGRTPQRPRRPASRSSSRRRR